MKQPRGEVTQALVCFIQLRSAFFDAGFQVLLSISQYFIISPIHFAHGDDERGSDKESKDANDVRRVRNAKYVHRRDEPKPCADKAHSNTQNRRSNAAE